MVKSKPEHIQNKEQKALSNKWQPMTNKLWAYLTPITSMTDKIFNNVNNSIFTMKINKLI